MMFEKTTEINFELIYIPAKTNELNKATHEPRDSNPALPLFANQL